MDKQIVGYVILDELGDFLGEDNKIFTTFQEAEAYLDKLDPDSEEFPGMTQVLSLVES